MLDKPKRKHDVPSPVTYWWNRFLFARGFEFETELTPAECADRLHAQSRRPSGCLDDLSVIARVSLVSNEVFDFDLRFRRRGRIDYTTAKATGTIVIDGGTGITIVRGTASLGIFAHPLLYGVLALLLPFLVILTPPPDKTSVCCTSALILGALVFFGWRTIRDRQHLTLLIHDTLADEKPKREA